MGQCFSAPGAAYGVKYDKNDYQLTIELTKALEHELHTKLGAEGRGLHEKVSTVEAKLPNDTVRDVRYLASVRNSLIHDTSVHCLQDRAKFITRFESAMAELQTVTNNTKKK